MSLRIGERAGVMGVELVTDEIGQLTNYYELLARWNKKVNLTSLPLDGYTDAAIDRLIIEPVISKGLIDCSGGRWFDLGSGGGSPALPLKIVCPRLSLTMVESRSRKTAFLREAIRELRLSTADVWSGRIEELGKTLEPGTATLVTVRGVRIDKAFLNTSAMLLKSDGLLVAFGTSQAPNLEDCPFELVSSLSVMTVSDRAIHVFRRAELPTAA